MKRAGETEKPTIAPDGGEEEIQELNVSSLVRQYNGSYRKLLAMRPDQGTVAPNGYVVSKTSLKNKPGAQGVLTITYSKPVAVFVSYSSTAIKDSIWISWERVQRPLRQHPKFATTGDTYTWAQVDAWEKEEDAALRAAYKYRVPTRNATTGKWDHDEYDNPLYTTMDVSGSMKLYCQKRQKGIESYDDYRPVVRRVRVFTSEPVTGGCGLITASCPRASAFPTYQFIKTADETTNQGQKGMWTRTEVWEGCLEFDIDLYGPNSQTPYNGTTPPASAPHRPAKGGSRAASK